MPDLENGTVMKMEVIIESRTCILGSLCELSHVELFSKNGKEEMFGDTSKAINNNIATLGKWLRFIQIPP